MKQVIILRKDLNMRKGKMVAQGAHASLRAIINDTQNPSIKWWLNNGMKKICVSCNSEKELTDLHGKALAAKMPCSIILDAGHTEFNQPTLTAVAIGPAEATEIDKITKELKLL